MGIDPTELENEAVESADLGVWTTHLTFGRRVSNWLESIVEVGENWEDDTPSSVIPFSRNDQRNTINRGSVHDRYPRSPSSIPRRHQFGFVLVSCMLESGVY